MTTNLVTLAEVKDYLTINSNTSDAKLSNLITYASGLIESYCSRTFGSANVTAEYHDGGLPYVFVNNPPLNNVWSVSEYSGSDYVTLVAPPTDGGLPNVAANANSAPGYSIDLDSGKIWKGTSVIISSSITTSQAFNSYAKGVRVSYNGGYTTIPADLKLCCLALIKDLHKGIDAQITRFDREQIQQMPYSAGFPPHIRRVLDLYRLVV
jgi:hypothetical protein